MNDKKRSKLQPPKRKLRARQPTPLNNAMTQQFLDRRKRERSKRK